MKSFKSITIRPLLYPLAMLCNTTIGIGLFSLPYIASRVGLLIMALYILVLGCIVGAIHLMFGEIALETPDFKRMPGFARHHLGQTAEIVISSCIIVSLIGIMVAFGSIGGEFLYNAAGPLLGGQPVLYSVIYLILGSLLVFFGINIVEKIEFWGLILFLLALAAIIFKALPYFKWDNLTIGGGTSDLFLPYGAVLFALWGASSIPEVEEMLGRKRKKKYLPALILVSSFVAPVIYLIFIVAVVGFTGIYTTESAIAGFGHIFGPKLLSLVYIFGLVVTFTSFVIVGLTLKKILNYDLKISKTKAWLITAGLPLVLLFCGLNNFLAIISFIGGVTLGIEGIVILLMYQKIRPDKKFITYPLGLVMFAAMFYEIFYFFKL